MRWWYICLFIFFALFHGKSHHYPICTMITNGVPQPRTPDIQIWWKITENIERADLTTLNDDPNLYHLLPNNLPNTMQYLSMGEPKVSPHSTLRAWAANNVSLTQPRYYYPVTPPMFDTQSEFDMWNCSTQSQQSHLSMLKVSIAPNIYHDLQSSL